MIESRRTFLKAAAAGVPLAIGAHPSGATASEQAASVGGELRTARSGEASIVCAGDWFLTRQVSAPVRPDTDAVFQLFRQADASFANLENGLSTVGSDDLGGFRQGGPVRGDPALAADLAWAGVRGVSLANNHTGNYGRDALLQTIAALDKERIAHAGAGRNIGEAIAPAYIHAGPITIAFFSVYTLYHEFGARDQASATEPGVAVCRAFDVVVQPQGGFDTSRFNTPPYTVDLQNPCSQTVIAALKGDIDRLKAAVKEASSRADFTLLSVHVHWGRHTYHDLPPNLRAFAQEMIDAGVDLFVGHGPHAIRGIELYRGKPIVHSMGNFLLMPPTGNGRPDLVSAGHEGLIVRAIVSAKSVKALEILPIAIDERGDPRFAPREQAAETLSRLTGLSAPFGTRLSRKGWFTEIVMS